MELPWTLISGWLNPEESKKWKLKIYKTLKWDQPIVKVFGKKYLVPRKTVFLGEHNIQYSYSGVIHRSNGWPIWFYPLVSKLSVMNNCNFNGCLINLYRNGNDKMGWHADNEKELNPNKPICSISLGASRDFYLKNCSTNKKKIIPLNNGDLLIMYPSCQRDWVHSIPIRKKIMDYRINLTFRCYL